MAYKVIGKIGLTEEFKDSGFYEALQAAIKNNFPVKETFQKELDSTGISIGKGDINRWDMLPLNLSIHPVMTKTRLNMWEELENYPRVDEEDLEVISKKTTITIDMELDTLTTEVAIWLSMLRPYIMYIDLSFGPKDLIDANMDGGRHIDSVEAVDEYMNNRYL